MRVSPQPVGRPAPADAPAELKPAQRVLMSFGDVYDALTDHPMWYRQNQALLGHLPNLAPGATVLDLGAGTGVGTLALAEARPDLDLIGVELCARMVERAERYRASHPQGDSVRFLCKDAANLALADGCVDAVVANSFLYLVPDPVAVLREAKRVLRPGGRVVMMEPRAETTPLDLLHAGAEGALDFLENPPSAMRLGLAMGAWKLASTVSQCPTQQQLRTYLREAGFADVRFEKTLNGLGQHVIARTPRA